VLSLSESHGLLSNTESGQVAIEVSSTNFRGGEVCWDEMIG
jgi:hypothetical protein